MPVHCMVEKARSSENLHCPTSRLEPRIFWWLQMWLVVVLISRTYLWLSTMIWPKISKVSASKGAQFRLRRDCLSSPSQSQAALKNCSSLGDIAVCRMRLCAVSGVGLESLSVAMSHLRSAVEMGGRQEWRVQWFTSVGSRSGLLAHRGQWGEGALESALIWSDTLLLPRLHSPDWPYGKGRQEWRSHHLPHQRGLSCVL